MDRSRDRNGSAESCQEHRVLHRPTIVGYMSVDMSRNYHSDLSQLKFVTDIPNGEISWDLDHNIDDAVPWTIDDKTKKYEMFLNFLIDHRRRFNFPTNTFISYRRTLISIMNSFKNRSKEPIVFTASLLKNNIYLFHTNQAKYSQTDLEKKYTSWGYKFQRYINSDQPNLPPDIDRPVAENEHFTLYYCSEIGDHKLFYGANSDGLLATSDTTPPPETTDVQENLAYLRSHQYVELKTNKELESSKIELTFRRHKLFMSWCQCYFSNAKGVVVGFRKEDGIVRRLQWFDTDEIPDYCKNEWNSETALNSLDRFLSFVKSTLYSHKQGNNNENQPLTLQFLLVNGQMSQIQNPEPITILPDWFIEALRT